MRRFGKTSWVAVCVAVAGCDLGFDPRTQDDLGAARARWAEVRPDAYVFALQRVCFCPIESIGPVRIVVEGDQVERTYVSSGLPVPAFTNNGGSLFPTVDGLFDVIQGAIDVRAHELHVEYDQDTGVPTEVWIDYNEMTADEELGFQVTEDVQAIP